MQATPPHRFDPRYSLPILVWYPINKASHARLRAELEKAHITHS